MSTPHGAIIDYTDDLDIDNIESAVIRGMPEPIYRKAKRMNQSSLKDWSVSIADGLHGSSFDASQSSAVMMGLATHCLLLDGEEVFNKKYITGGPINESTGKPYGRSSQKFKDWLALQDGLMLTELETESVHGMAKAIRNDSFVHALITMPGGERELTVLWTEIIDGTKIRCKGRLDWWHPEIGIVDMKCTVDTEPRKFSYSVADRGWFVQYFVYSRGAYMSGLHPCMPDWGWVAVQSAAPHKVECYRPDPYQHMSNCGRAVAYRGLKNYAAYQKNKIVRASCTGFKTIDLPPSAWQDEGLISESIERME